MKLTNGFAGSSKKSRLKAIYLDERCDYNATGPHVPACRPAAELFNVSATFIFSAASMIRTLNGLSSMLRPPTAPTPAISRTTSSIESDVDHRIRPAAAA